MNILFQLAHPAHVHFFKGIINELENNGNVCHIIVRNKDITNSLIIKNGLNEKVIASVNQKKNKLGLVFEFIETCLKLSKLFLKYKIDLSMGIGGDMLSITSWLFSKPCLIFTDTDNAQLTNFLPTTFATKVLVPDCFDSLSSNRVVKYPGYHELAYLHPLRLDESINYNKYNDKLFIVRFVSWDAVHDIGDNIITNDQKINLVKMLLEYGKVIISSEDKLPKEIEKDSEDYQIEEMHSYMASSSMFIGESATMASESACLGVPAIYISDTGRCYTNEQEKTYGLVKYFKPNQWNLIKETIGLYLNNDLNNHWKNKQQKLLDDKVDVTSWVVKYIEDRVGAPLINNYGFLRKKVSY